MASSVGQCGGGSLKQNEVVEARREEIGYMAKRGDMGAEADS